MKFLAPPSLLLLGLAMGVPASAVGVKPPSGPLAPLAFSRPELHSAGSLVDLETAGDRLSADTIRRWRAYRDWAAGRWSAVVDRRTGRIALAEGGRVAMHPGAGNRLTAADVAGWTGDGSARDLAALARPAGRFLARVAPLLGVDATALQLDRERSGRLAPHLWVLDYDLILDGRPLRDARVVLRVNNGNLVQWGSENLPAAGTRVPPARRSREAARAVVARYIGGFEDEDTFLDRGSLALLPFTVRLPSEPAGYRWARGRRTVLVWEIVFRRAGIPGSWRARVDANTGTLLELVDTNRSSSVVGGVYPMSPSDNETKLAMPFADVGGGVYANSAGYFAPVAGRSSTLQGPYVTIHDRCGSILQRADSNTNISFGTSGGTDCRTPGNGGGGNTHASRTEYYHLNRLKEAARGWLPTNAWLSSPLQANVNLNLTCDAYWDGTTVNFARSYSRPGRGCSNLGELPGVGLHELGHGLDANDGVPSSDLGSAGAYADLTAAIQLQTSCIGRGFKSAPCTGYGMPATPAPAFATSTGATAWPISRRRSPTSRSRSVLRFPSTAAPVGSRRTASRTWPRRRCGISPTATYRRRAAPARGRSSTASGTPPAAPPARRSVAPRERSTPATAATSARGGRRCAPRTTTMAICRTARRIRAPSSRPSIATASPATPTPAPRSARRPAHRRASPSSRCCRRTVR